jgi:hypothetical protein
MKTLVNSLILCISLLSTTSMANGLAGSWELISGEYINDKNVTIDYVAHKLESIKVISPSHYSFVTVSDGKLWAAGTGTYKVTPKHYIETVIHTSYGAAKETKYTFLYKLEGEFWYSTRIEDGKRMEYEVWRKLK